MNTTEDKNAAVAKVFLEFLNSEYTPDILAESIDEISWTLTRYMIEDKDANGYSGRSDGLFFLRKLKNICLGKSLNEA